MKNLLLILVLLCTTVGVAAQTEAGKIRVGGSSNLSFLNTKHDGFDDKMNELDFEVSGGYFIIDNLSLDLGLHFGYEKDGDDDASSAFIGELGARYYLPTKIFVGASFDFLSLKQGDSSASGTGVNLKAGYSWFVKDNIALEPVVGYRIGLSKKDDYTKYNELSIRLGLSVFF